MPDPQPLTIVKSEPLDTSAPLTIVKSEPAISTTDPASGRPSLRGFMDFSNQPSQLQTLGDLATGVGKGMLSTARGVGNLLPQSSQDALSRFRQKTGLPPVSTMTTPTTTIQSIGKGAEQIGEFFVPGGVLEHVLPAAGMTTRMLSMAGANAAIAKAQGAGPVGTVVAGALGAAGEAPRLMAGAATAANRIEKSVLRAGAKDYANGFNPANVFKYDLGGSALETYTKATQKLNDLGQQLKSVLSSVPNAPVDMSAVNKTVLDGYRGNPEAAAALDRINQAIQFRLNGQGVMPRTANGRIVLDLPDANTAKQAVGELGAWLTDPRGQLLSDADRNLEDVANRYYGALKQQILTTAGASGPEVQALNRQMADIIPIKTAAWRRFPVADRQNMFHLMDNLAVIAALHSGNPLPAAVALTNRAATSGTVANALSKGVGVNPTIGQLGAAATTALSSDK